MLLYPSSSPPWNTTFRNEEAQVIYKTEFLTRFGAPRQITIKRILPPNSIDLAAGSEDALRDSFSDLAEIHYNILSGRILYNGIETATNQFFRRSGFMGRWELGRLVFSSIQHLITKFYSHRVFTGSDGKEYEWELRPSACNVISDHWLSHTWLPIDS